MADGKLCQLRTKEFSLTQHCHGKTRVKVLKVRRADDGTHTISEYEVATTLYSPVYERVFTQNDNNELVATDTQKNTVYVVAKRTQARTPEEFGIDLCSHLLAHYPLLTGQYNPLQLTLT